MQTKPDSLIHGHVNIKLNSNQIVDTNNMVLYEGRMILLNKLFKNVNIIDGSRINEYDNYNYSNIVLFADNTSTTLEYKYDLKKTVKITDAIKTDSTISFYNKTNESNENIPILEFTINHTFSGAELPIALSFNSIGLLFSNGNPDADKLFSRAQFDPITIKSGDGLSLTYYLYF